MHYCVHSNLQASDKSYNHIQRNRMAAFKTFQHPRFEVKAKTSFSSDFSSKLDVKPVPSKQARQFEHSWLASISTDRNFQDASSCICGILSPPFCVAAALVCLCFTKDSGTFSQRLSQMPGNGG